MLEFDKSRFDQAVALWAEWNDRINVVSRKDIENLYEHHILHSLSIAEYLARQGVDTSGLRFLDVGTGGGFPGIPLAMAMPEAQFTLCDSIGKKVRVAQEVVNGLGLTNVECLNCRAETVRGNFDYVVSRAVTSLENFYPWVRGRFSRSILYLKGGDINEEILRMCSRCGVDPARVGAWRIDEWLQDDYFAEKFVIEIRK